MDHFPAELDATALAHLIRSGKTTARRVMQASLRAAAELDHLGAIRFHDADLGLSEAESFDKEASRESRAPDQTFAGVPFLMKDLGAAARNLPTVAGSRSMIQRLGPSRSDSILTTRFRAMGLLPFGSTTVSEFGMALSSEPSTGPIARNPTHPDRTPGGSSGGAAAAVASGIVAIAHATDAAGSTRVPAACCGLVGLKTTRGAVPAGPDFNNHLSGLVSEFILARSLRDAAATLHWVSGGAQGPYPDPFLYRNAADLGAPLDPIRIGVVDHVADGPGIQADRKAGIRHAADVLARAGHTVCAIDADRFRPFTATALSVTIDLVCANLARGLSTLQPALERNEIEPLNFAIYERGLDMKAVDVCAAEISAARVAHGMWKLFENVDVMLLPMLSEQPPAIGRFSLNHTDIQGHWQAMHEFAPFAMIANVGGFPALSVPHGVDATGFSIPVQLMGPMGADFVLLRLAKVLERAEPWTFAYPVAGLDS